MVDAADFLVLLHKFVDDDFGVLEGFLKNTVMVELASI